MFTIVVMFLGSQIFAYSINNIGEIFKDIFKKSHEFR